MSSYLLSSTGNDTGAHSSSLRVKSGEYHYTGKRSPCSIWKMLYRVSNNHHFIWRLTVFICQCEIVPTWRHAPWNRPWPQDTRRSKTRSTRATCRRRLLVRKAVLSTCWARRTRNDRRRRHRRQLHRWP